MSKEAVFERDGRIIHATQYGESDKGVVLCPPHPLFGGNRDDSRLISIASELSKKNICGLCVDYSDYTGGVEEVKDILQVISEFSKNLDAVGLVGYSFGSVIASLAAAQTDIDLKGLVLIALIKEINGLKSDMSSKCKKLIIYGTNDSFVTGNIDELFNSTPGEKEKLTYETDHFFSGYEDKMAKKIGEFFSERFS